MNREEQGKGREQQEMEPGDPLSDLETRLGYAFRDRTLAETALTHTSWLNEAPAPGAPTTSGSSSSATPCWRWW